MRLYRTLFKIISFISKILPRKVYLSLPEFPYKIVDIQYKNGFILKVITQVSGKNIILEETLEEIISKNKSLVGYSSADIELIMAGFYKKMYGSQYALVGFNFDSSQGVQATFRDLMTDEVLQYSCLELGSERDFFKKIKPEEAILIHHFIAQEKSQTELKNLKETRKKASQTKFLFFKKKERSEHS